MEEEVKIKELKDQNDNDNDELCYGEGTNAIFQVEETSSGRGKKRKHTSQLSFVLQNFSFVIVLFGDRLKETSDELSE